MKHRFLLGITAGLLVGTLNLPVWAQEIEYTSVSKSPYFQMDKATLDNGPTLTRSIISGPPVPPPGIVRSTLASPPQPDIMAGINILPDVPAFSWSFGCSATSASMIAGYYDRTTYPDMYTGPTNGSIMPMDNSSWPDWVDAGGDTRHQCPLSATHAGLDGRTSLGHVDDYWIQYGNTGPDPYDGNWAEHTLGDCTGDFMKTNRAATGNSDGGTNFYNFTNGAPLYAADMVGYGIDDNDGGYGLKLFYESRGYTVRTMYNQYIYGYPDSAGTPNTIGFTYDQYKAEIDAGRPVLFHVEGHTMVGVGYDDSSSNMMYIHDTWDYNTHTMEWGGSYSGMQQYAVTIIHLAPNAVAPNNAMPTIYNSFFSD